MISLNGSHESLAGHHDNWVSCGGRTEGCEHSLCVSGTSCQDTTQSIPRPTEKIFRIWLKNSRLRTQDTVSITLSTFILRWRPEDNFLNYWLASYKSHENMLIYSREGSIYCITVHCTGPLCNIGQSDGPSLRKSFSHAVISQSGLCIVNITVIFIWELKQIIAFIRQW